MGLFPSKSLDPLILGSGFMILKVFSKGIWLNITLFSGSEALYCIALGMVSLLVFCPLVQDGALTLEFHCDIL